MSDTMNSTQTRIFPLLTAVATELGNGWHVPAGQNHDNQGLILTDGTVSLFARLESGPYTEPVYRVVFAGNYPDGSRDVYTTPEQNRYAKTTVSLDRAPKAVARQLASKLLPTVTELTAYYTERLTVNATDLATRKDFLLGLTSFGVSIPKYGRNAGEFTDASVYIGGVVSGDLSIYHDASGGKLELHGLSAEQITAILAFVKANTDALKR